MNSEQNEPKMKQQHARSPEPMNELGMQNSIRKRYCNNWPAVILELTNRVQGVNNVWSQIMMKIMTIDDLRVTYARECTGDLIIRISIKDEHEQHNVTASELQDAAQYIEVLVMDKIANSKLIAKHTK